LGTGDEIRVIHRPDHDVTIRDVFRIYLLRDRDEINRLIIIPQIPESWKRWAEKLLKEHPASSLTSKEIR
jgi:MOSC domain-containing protein YiiM